MFRKKDEVEVYNSKKRMKILCKKCGKIHFTDSDCINEDLSENTEQNKKIDKEG